MSGIKSLMSNVARKSGADLFLRDNDATLAALAGATAIWFILELMAYHLLTLVCRFLIVILILLFVWFNITTYLNKSPPDFPDLSISEDMAVKIALSLRSEINGVLAASKQIVLGRDLKKFLALIAGLWVISIVSSWCSFHTLLYIAFCLMHGGPLLYEKYEDQIDSFGENVMEEIRKQYAGIDANFLSKISKGLAKDKKKR